MARKLQRLATASVVGALALSVPPASADLLISSPNESPVCGDAIEVGIWYRPYPHKNTKRERRFVIKAIDDATGRVWWTKNATATTRWRNWQLPSGRKGQCGSTTIDYYHDAGKRYGDPIKVRFSPED
jgi:hypothetical protein